MMGMPSAEDQVKDLTRTLAQVRGRAYDWEGYARALEGLLAEAKLILENVKDPRMETFIKDFLVKLKPRS